MILFIVMIVSLAIASLWESLPFIKQIVHAVLDPTAGVLLDWNLNIGMVIIVFCVSIIISLAQKYLTDQDTLREIKKEQRILQEEMKKYKNEPEKLLELQKKQFEFFPKTMDITMRPLIYTGIPIILFFRWFQDYFSAAGNPKIFGFFSWIWFYLLFSIICSMIIRKAFKIE